MTFPVVPRRGSEARTPLGCQGQLTNARRESAQGHGITLLRTLVDDYAAPPLVTRAPLLLITLNGSQDKPDGEEMADGRLRYRAGRRGFPELPRILPAHEVGEAGPVDLNSDWYLDGAGLLLGGQRPEKCVGTKGVVQHMDVNLQDMFIR